MPLSTFRAFVSRHYHRLMQIRDTPHAIAGGIAIGVFIGFTPLFGFKTALAILVAWLLRCSKVSSAVAVAFHDFVWFIWPLVMRWQYMIGFWLWYSPHHFPKKLKFERPTIEHLFDWHKFVNVIWPMFIGSILMGIPVSLVFYFVALRIVKRYQAKIRAKAATETITSSSASAS